MGVLNVEMTDALCMCFTGRLSRLINCLSGFSDLVQITIPENSAIGNIIVTIRQQLESEDGYNTQEHICSVKKELESRGYEKGHH